MNLIINNSDRYPLYTKSPYQTVNNIFINDINITLTKKKIQSLQRYLHHYLRQLLKLRQITQIKLILHQNIRKTPKNIIKNINHKTKSKRTSTLQQHKSFLLQNLLIKNSPPPQNKKISQLTNAIKCRILTRSRYPRKR